MLHAGEPDDSRPHPPGGALRLYPDEGRSAAEWKLAQEYLHWRAGHETTP